MLVKRLTLELAWRPQIRMRLTNMISLEIRLDFFPLLQVVPVQLSLLTSVLQITLMYQTIVQLLFMYQRLPVQPKVLVLSILKKMK